MSQEFIEVFLPTDTVLSELVKKHPFIVVSEKGNSPNGELPFEPVLAWKQGARYRQILSSESMVAHGYGPDPESFEVPYGIVELMDNNPLVCADTAIMPGIVASHVLLALGPLIRAGLMLEAPAVMTNINADDQEVSLCLQTVGWNEGVVIHFEELPGSEGSLALAVLAEIAPIDDVSAIRELFKESYERSYFMKHDTGSEWSVELVQDFPGAVYRVTLELGETNHLVKVLVLSSLKHRASNARALQFFNVMCGFEETLPY